MAVILVFVISLCYIKNVGRQGLRVVSSATAYISGGTGTCRRQRRKQAGGASEIARSACATMRVSRGVQMSNVELLNTLLTIAGLMLSVYALGKQNRQ